MKRFIFLLAACAALHVHALTPDQARALALGDSDARIEALNKAVAAADDRTAAFLQALGPIRAAAEQDAGKLRPGEAAEALRWHNQAIELYNAMVL